ncbi:hypothetical protein QBC42DRAFT_232163 [Cladorrhinum samala]|uniref:DUF676 domain-containing protein n=1 Tax=Cladorrhinum samala TaxID=585594 RepID=A0AAV9HF11_9PEZI|nr:hypothetical protein QBC42DRAFT_232163 [Cladorrhinum samala]
MAPAKRMVLKVLYDPASQQRDEIAPTVDLVLVHGLEGDPIETWTHPESKVLWATDLLPRDLPATRVLSFGYNADMYCNNSIAGIRGNAEFLMSSLKARRSDDPHRPILFVAHCLGGLIVKQLLSFASQDPARHGAICSATKGILFFGTPNNAVDRRQWETLAERYYSRYDRRKSNLAGLVTALTKDAPDLSEVNEDFRHISDRWPIFSFYESLSQRGAGAPILDIQVARMFVDNEEGIPVDADHTDMSRAEHGEDDVYVNIARCVRQCLYGDEMPAATQPREAAQEEVEVPAPAARPMLEPQAAAKLRNVRFRVYESRPDDERERRRPEESVNAEVRANEQWIEDVRDADNCCPAPKKKRTSLRKKIRGYFKPKVWV